MKLELIPFQLKIFQVMISKLRYLIIFKIDECFYEGRISIFLWFVGVADELGVFLAGFDCFGLQRIPGLFLGIFFEVSGIEWVFYHRNVRRFLIMDFVPVYACEKRMCFDLFDSVYT